MKLALHVVCCRYFAVRHGLAAPQQQYFCIDEKYSDRIFVDQVQSISCMYEESFAARRIHLKTALPLPGLCSFAGGRDSPGGWAGGAPGQGPV